MNTNWHPREPTPEECSANAPIDGGYAFWWPSMGGYVGRCVGIENAEHCLDIYVWHDGAFPFSSEPETGWDCLCPGCANESPPRRQPIPLHMCLPSQFVRFGQDLARMFPDIDTRMIEAAGRFSR